MRDSRQGLRGEVRVLLQYPVQGGPFGRIKPLGAAGGPVGHLVLSAVLLVDRQDYRALWPCLDTIFEQRLARADQVPCLAVVDQLLELDGRDGAGPRQYRRRDVVHVGHAVTSRCPRCQFYINPGQRWFVRLGGGRGVWPGLLGCTGPGTRRRPGRPVGPTAGRPGRTSRVWTGPV